jgi:hypothetical protein
MTITHDKPTTIRGNIDKKKWVTLWRVDKVIEYTIDPEDTPQNDLAAAGVEFTAAIKKAFRGCELRAAWSGTDSMNFKAFVYMPGDTYCMGYVTIIRGLDCEDVRPLGIHSNCAYHNKQQAQRYCTTADLQDL